MVLPDASLGSEVVPPGIVAWYASLCAAVFGTTAWETTSMFVASVPPSDRFAKHCVCAHVIWSPFVPAALAHGAAMISPPVMSATIDIAAAIRRRRPEPERSGIGQRAEPAPMRSPWDCQNLDGHYGALARSAITSATDDQTRGPPSGLGGSWTRCVGFRTVAESVV